MPVRKFRGVEEMPDETWRAPGDPALFRTMRYLWTVAARTSRRRFPPGVHKHRSIEEMQAAQEAWAGQDKGNAERAG